MVSSTARVTLLRRRNVWVMAKVKGPRPIMVKVSNFQPFVFWLLCIRQYCKSSIDACEKKNTLTGLHCMGMKKEQDWHPASDIQ